MGVYTVTTPVAGHSGKVGGVTFVDGLAVVDGDDHEAELAYFTAQGYGVIEVVPPTAEPDPDVANPPDIDALRAEAVALGIEVVPQWREKRLTDEIAKAHEATDTQTTGTEPGNDEEIQS